MKWHTDADDYDWQNWGYQMDFASLRESIPCMGSMTYMNAGWAGPSPSQVVEGMRDAAERESAGGPAGPEGRAVASAVEEEARTEAAQLFNVDPADMLITHGTSEGVAITLFGLDWKRGDVLLTTDLEHPGIDSPVAVLEERGVEIRRVSIPPDASADACIEAMRSGLDSRVKVAALSHVMFTTGLRVPAEEIVGAAHEVGALVLFDGAQTAGHIAMDFTAMEVDFYASSGQKWLQGPTGSGAFYVRPDRRELLKPLLRRPGTGFRQGLGLYSLASQGIAERAGYAEAVRIHRELGPERVEEHTAGLATSLREELSGMAGISINGPTDGPTACAITVISVDGWEAPAFVETLWETYRVVARHVAHPAGVRFCTAAFNDESDVERAVSAIAELAGR